MKWLDKKTWIHEKQITELLEKTINSCRIEYSQEQIDNYLDSLVYWGTIKSHLGCRVELNCGEVIEV